MTPTSVIERFTTPQGVSFTFVAQGSAGDHLPPLIITRTLGLDASSHIFAQIQAVLRDFEILQIGKEGIALRGAVSGYDTVFLAPITKTSLRKYKVPRSTRGQLENSLQVYLGAEDVRLFKASTNPQNAIEVEYTGPTNSISATAPLPYSRR